MRKIDAKERKNTPIFSGVLSYFPDALAAVAVVSRIGNEQHNPGTELHWDRTKSQDEGDACARHLVDRAAGDEFDSDGQRHYAKIAWRALAALQKEIENERHGTEVIAQPEDNPNRGQALGNRGSIDESRQRAQAIGNSDSGPRDWTLPLDRGGIT